MMQMCIRDRDKTGALCAEQMLFAACWQTMAQVSAALGEENPEYMEKYEKLIGQIRKFYWDQEKGAFIAVSYTHLDVYKRQDYVLRS